MPHITIVSGTNREGSRTLAFASFLKGRLEGAGATTSLLDLRDLPSDAVAPTVYAKTPASVQPMIDTWMQADGLLVVTPEYNGGFPGVLKLFFDLLPHPESVKDRPVAFAGIAAGRWGALRPIEQLTQLWHYRQGIVFPERVQIHGAATMQGADGGPTDPFVQELLATFVPRYVDFVSRLAGYPAPQEA